MQRLTNIARTLAGSAFAFAAASAFADTPPVIKEMKPGKYKYVVETNNPGMPIKMPATTISQCITAKDLQEGKGLQAQKDAGVKCEFSDVKSGAGQYSFKSVCEMQGGIKMQNEYDVKASDKAIILNMKSTMKGANIPPAMANTTTKMTATREGDC
jgi:hypothetical protein